MVAIKRQLLALKETPYALSTYLSDDPDSAFEVVRQSLLESIPPPLITPARAAKIEPTFAAIMSSGTRIVI